MNQMNQMNQSDCTPGVLWMESSMFFFFLHNCTAFLVRRKGKGNLFYMLCNVVKNQIQIHFSKIPENESQLHQFTYNLCGNGGGAWDIHQISQNLNLFRALHPVPGYTSVGFIIFVFSTFILLSLQPQQPWKWYIVYPNTPVYSICVSTAQRIVQLN